MSNFRSFALCVGVLAGFVAGPARAADCSAGSFNSTYDLIQKAVFENRGCTNSVCHGEAATGGLDLRADVSYNNLVDVESATIPGWKRVLVGQTAASLFYVNLAAKTNPAQWTAPLRAMPLDPVPALTQNELDAIRLWIERGAPRDGVVPGTDRLLDACLPPPEPIEIKPLPPPAPGTGVQIKMPRLVLRPHSEQEVCFATYYDVTDQVPAELRRADGTFRYKYHETRQDPLSHHMVPVLYDGGTPITSPVWGNWTCHGGNIEGQACDPLNLTSCGSGICTSQVSPSIACIGYGPGDGGIGLSTAGISITQQTAEEFKFAPGVYDSLPTKGVIMWSSHAFNLTDQPGKLEAWLNFEFAGLDEQIDPAVQIFDASAVFKANAPAFGTDEPCNISTFPPNTHLFELTSHTHKRGKRWRTFRGAFRCQGGPIKDQACSPIGYDFVSPDVCQGSPCTGTTQPKSGDCDLSGDVSVDEIVRGVTIALGSGDIESCHQMDVNEDSEVSVDELVTSVGAALNGVPAPVARDGMASLMYVSLIYNDPLVLHRNDHPMVLQGGADDRSFTFCSLYDNGYTHPAEVKTKSGSPKPPIAFPGVGGPCDEATNCTAGKVGNACKGRGQLARNASCDSVTGMGDGKCDACPLHGGVTTEDEMFILLGRYYVP